jgi:hypothetical protein
MVRSMTVFRALERLQSRQIRFFRVLCLSVMAILLAGPNRAAAAEIAPRTLASGEMLKGRFIQDRQLAGFAKPLRSEGDFTLIPGQGLIWFGKTPFENTTVITRSGILQMVNGQEAMRLTAARIPGLGHFYEVLEAAVSGDTKSLMGAFTVKRTADAEHWSLMLTPLHAGEMAQLKSLFVKGGRMVDSIDVDKGGGDIDHISFLDQSIGPLSLTAEEKTLMAKLHK